MQFRLFNTTQYVITACAVLHNIAIDANEREMPLDPQIELEIARTIDGLDDIAANPNNNIQNNLRSQLLEKYFQQLINEAE